MGTKMGRPKSENPMNERLNIRVTKKEKEELHDFCREHGYTLLELIRLGIEKVLNK